MRIIFAATAEIAVPSLLAIHREFTVSGVLTAADKAAGRGLRLVPPPVKTAAASLGIPVFQPPSLGRRIREELVRLNPELLVVFAYGRIFGPKFLSIFPRGGINMHPSALPRHRGPAPLVAAILSGDSEIALTVQRVAPAMDSGDILRQTAFPLSGRETAGDLALAVAPAAAGELAAAVRCIAAGRDEGLPQDHAAATYCSIVRKEDGNIDWRRPAAEIERMIRAYTPWPKACTTLEGAKLTILEADVSRPPDSGSDPQLPVPGGRPGTYLGVDKSQGMLIQTGDGVLAVTRLQSATKKPMGFQSFLNGVRLAVGTALGEQL